MRVRLVGSHENIMRSNEQAPHGEHNAALRRRMDKITVTQENARRQGISPTTTGSWMPSKHVPSHVARSAYTMTPVTCESLNLGKPDGYTKFLLTHCITAVQIGVRELQKIAHNQANRWKRRRGYGDQDMTAKVPQSVRMFFSDLHQLHQML